MLEARSAAEIVKGVSASGLTAATSATTMFVPGRRGRYRANCTVYVTTGGDAITVTLNVIHTDRVGAVTFPVVNALTLLATGRASGVYVFEAKESTAIQFSTTLSGARVVSVHAVELAIERLA